MCKCGSVYVIPCGRGSRSEVFEVTEGVRSSADDSASSSPGRRAALIWACRNKQRMMENYFMSECVSLSSCRHIQPCPASCSAGWQPCDRPPSLDRTLCSRTEPAAPLKEAHRPTGRDGDRKGGDSRVTSTSVCRMAQIFSVPECTRSRSKVIWVWLQSKTRSWWLISVRSQQTCWAVGCISMPESGCVQQHCIFCIH